MSFDRIKERPWQAQAYLDYRLPIQTMLVAPEQRMLYWLTREYFRNDGAVIDAGCFIGGSTYALAQGMAHGRKAGAIHSLDLFLADHYAVANYDLGGIPVGGDIRPIFERQIAPYRDYVRPYHGDIQKVSWGTCPIEILFIDVAKTPSINDHLVREFFPSLIPGRSVVVQQDYLHDWLPWIHITMERLSGKFELLADTGINSVVYGCVEPISPDDVQCALWDSMTPVERAEFHALAESRWEGEQRGFLSRAGRYLATLNT